MSGKPREEVVEKIHSYLESVRDVSSLDVCLKHGSLSCSQDIANNRVVLEQYIITKSLTKHPKDYPDAKNQPHVSVALWMLDHVQCHFHATLDADC